MTWPSQITPAARYSRVASLLAAILLLGPAVLLCGTGLRTEGLARSIAVGIGVTLGLESLFLLFRFGPQRAASSFFLLVFYGLAAITLRLNAPDFSLPNTHLFLSLSLLIPVGLFVRRELASTGGNTRRVKFIIRQLLSRKEWPANFADYRNCPRIQALREGLRENAAPALPLLAHDDVRIQVAVLTALEFHPAWRKGQVEAVLQRASYTEEAAVRTASVLALANVVKPRHLQSLLGFLRDPNAEVRRAAGMAILWDSPRRWTEIRSQVRQSLAAPHAAKDGALPCSAVLPPAAIADLVNWSIESGPIGRRSTQTLVRHCQKVIQEDGSAEAIGRIATLVADNKVPPALRVELAHRLRQADAFPHEIAYRMLGQNHPTMLRVVAAGAILSRNPDPRAVEVLREAALQPNREIALAAAAIVQKYLSVDMGLEVGGEMPAINSREAADITRRARQWSKEPGSQSGVETPADAAVPNLDAAYF
jgi:HEAT repeat protein